MRPELPRRQAERRAVRRSRGRWCAALAATALLPVIAACGSESGGGSGASSGSSGGGRPITQLKMLVPQPPGGGYDTTARAAAQAAQTAKVSRNIQVSNVTGGSGTVGLAKLVNQKGTPKSLMMMGLGLVGAVHANKSDATLLDTTPVASLIQEPDLVLVPADSKYKTLKDFLADWKANTRGLAIASGSAPGGPDHLATMITAKAAGVDPKNVNHVTLDGGAEVMTALLGNKVAAGFSGVGESQQQVEAGKVRALAVTGPQRVAGIDAPTLKEAGVDAEMVNWRGLVAPPGVSGDDLQELVDFATRLHDSAEWKEAMKKNGWIDFFTTGEKYKQFIASENARVEGVLSELGLEAG
jgi:putative tricarboxylic transport membrane protein